MITVPLRFDFDAQTFKEVIHPYSHMTLGNYKDCRIPVKCPIAPKKFILFLLRNFYSKMFYDCFSGTEFETKLVFPDTISGIETNEIYISA